jgi:hypothetical protein
MKSVYLETTIVSYLVSRPSRELIVAGHQEVTREWWERRREKFACYISDVVLDEARQGDAAQAGLRLKAMEDFPRLAASEAAERLAAMFLQVLPAKAAQDAAHLAIASAGKINYLLTWNCAHLANVEILDRLDPISLAAGFRLPRVCTPEELMGESTYD